MRSLTRSTRLFWSWILGKALPPTRPGWYRSIHLLNRVPNIAASIPTCESNPDVSWHGLRNRSRSIRHRADQTILSIIRRLRELNVYSELLPCTTRLSELRFKPAGLVLSGGPYSVYDDGAPHFDPAYLHLGIPILGICYGLSELAYRLDRTNVVAGVPGEYALAEVTAKITNAHFDPLFYGIEGPMKAWMSHGDRLAKLPEGFHSIATTEDSECAAIAHDTHPIYGVQFHPEVPHTPKGAQLLRNFAVDICGINSGRMTGTFVEQETGRKRKTGKPSSRVLGGVSGGADSTVAARLGHRFAAMMVDHGHLRHEEREQVEKDLNVGAHQDWSVYEAAAILLTLRRSTSGLT